MKFGGTSVGDASCIRRVAEIIHNSIRDFEVVVVASAMSGVTNKLIDAAVQAELGKPEQAAEILEAIRDQHEHAIDVLIYAKGEQDRIRWKIHSLLSECAVWCEETARKHELTPRTRDLISSLGERLSVPLVAAALDRYGLIGEPIESTELVVTDSCHGGADPKMELTTERCEYRLRPLLRKGVIPVVTGFIGATEGGVLTTLGRGGSDYSATIVGKALKADEVVIWTDVDGVLTADPRLVPGATTIPEISYREASELAYFGAKVLHPKTLRPVMEDGIPVWVRNTFVPGKRGTKITPVGNANRGGVKALTAIGEAALITIDAIAIFEAKDGIARILTAMKLIRTDVLMITKSSSRRAILLVVPAQTTKATLEALRQEFAHEFSGAAERMTADGNISLLTVVGENLRAVKDTVANALEQLNRDDVNVLASGQGASACNVSFVVPKQDQQKALAITHGEFGSGEDLDLPGNRAWDAPRTRPGLHVDVDSGNGRAHRAPNFASAAKVLDAETFRSMIAQERRRTERSRNPVLLMLLDVGDSLSRDKTGKLLDKILSALSFSTRDTDITGWYRDQAVIGVMFTEIGIDDSGVILGTMMHRVSETLRSSISLDNFSQINVSMNVFPESWKQDTSGNRTLYPDLENREQAQRRALAMKRILDVVASAAAVVFLAPLFLLVAMLVRLSSKGPILFKQERIGQFGRPFTFLKFRSMYANNDPKIHQEFMRRAISGDVKKGSKMENDPRITPIGRFIRKTSLDELPQFFSVLKGDMSLVGPRPPLAYECQEYDIWHRRRVLEVKPGITGLWQVTGRSRLRFDEMVRLDLQYVRTWSLWNDIKIVLKTPFAVVRGGDAF